MITSKSPADDIKKYSYDLQKWFKFASNLNDIYWIEFLKKNFNENSNSM